MCFNNNCLLFFEFKIEGISSWIKLSISAILCTVNLYFFYSILYYFNSFYILIPLIVNNFTEIELTIITNEKFNLLYLIIFIVLCILILISFSMFLEIIEFNLFGLNKDTRRNIIKREENDENLLPYEEENYKGKER